MTHPKTWKIGELAAQTGLTVRALHHYEELGLLTPELRGDNNYRLYTETDVSRLQQIVSLKALGFSLEQIKDALTKPEFSPEKVLGLHLENVTLQLQTQTQLKERLEGMQRFLNSRGTLTAEEFLEAIRLMQEAQGMYTDEEMQTIRTRGNKLGQAKIESVEQEWPRLIAAMKTQLDAGKPADDPETLRLAGRWKQLVELFTGGDPAIAAKLKDMYQKNPRAGRTFGGPGHDPKMFAYVDRAMKELED